MIIFRKTIGDKEMGDQVGRFYVSIHIPTLKIYKKETDIVGNMYGWKIDFPTKIASETSEKHFKFEFRIIGIGFTISYHEE